MAGDAASRSGGTVRDGPICGGTVRAFAPAKINLYLQIIGRRPDGYHLLDSLIAFADIGDWVTAAPADALSLSLKGCEAAGLLEDSGDNLVLRAARLLAAADPETPRGAALHLEKNLPVSSGIGGGSSDAAATLRALFSLWRYRPDAAVLADLALKLGADTPACLAGTPVWVGGIGESLVPAAGLPAAAIVLANPRCALSTPAVFKARQGPFSAAARFPLPADAAGLAAALRDRCNDLTEPAVSLVPEIAELLALLERLPGALLARMSGSGATCFALFADRAAAVAANTALTRQRPDWWSAAGTLMTRAPTVDVSPST